MPLLTFGVLDVTVSWIPCPCMRICILQVMSEPNGTMLSEIWGVVGLSVRPCNQRRDGLACSFHANQKI